MLNFVIRRFYDYRNILILLLKILTSAFLTQYHFFRANPLQRTLHQYVIACNYKKLLQLNFNGFNSTEIYLPGLLGNLVIRVCPCKLLILRNFSICWRTSEEKN